MTEIDSDLPEAAEEFEHSEEGTPTESKADIQNWDRERDGFMSDYATDEAGEPLTVCPHSDDAEEVGDDAQED